MDPNPYAPPESVVADIPVPAAATGDTPIFFPASRTKLLVMSLCTFGLYEYYWFYKNWKLVRDRVDLPK